MQDFGYVQTTSTEVLKPYVFNEPILVDAARVPSLGAVAIFMVKITIINHILVIFLLIFSLNRNSFSICSKGTKECQEQLLQNQL